MSHGCGSSLIIQPVEFHHCQSDTHTVKNYYTAKICLILYSFTSLLNSIFNISETGTHTHAQTGTHLRGGT